jgi:hypothetical protein
LEVYGLKSKDFSVSPQSEPELNDLDLETYSLLTIPIQTNLLITSGNLVSTLYNFQWKTLNALGSRETYNINEMITIRKRTAEKF